MAVETRRKDIEVGEIHAKNTPNPHQMNLNESSAEQPLRYLDNSHH